MLHEVSGIGYRSRTLAELLDELTAREVHTLIDVRHDNRVAKDGFDRDHLGAALAARDITYRHLPSLGNPSWNRAGFAHPGEVREDARRRYAARLGEDPAREAMNVIWKAAHQGPVVLLCAEEDEHACHRHVLLERLAAHLPVVTAPDPESLQPQLFAA
jgi:uncharacterized protein (DUF488 family)